MRFNIQYSYFCSFRSHCVYISENRLLHTKYVLLWTSLSLPSKDFENNLVNTMSFSTMQFCRQRTPGAEPAQAGASEHCEAEGGHP